MRPTWDWEHGTADAASHQSGTPGHTQAPAEPAVDESFFQAGDEGRYEGGPAILDEEPFVLDEPPARIVVRTPEQDLRRARLIRVVAMSVGAFAALFAFGIVKQSRAVAQEDLRPPRTAQAALVSPVKEMPAPAVKAPTPVVQALRDTEQALPPVAEDEMPAPSPAEPSVVTPVAPKAPAHAVKPAIAWTTPASPAIETPARPVATTTVTVVPQAKRTGGGTVADFASRGPGSTTSAPPTAAFAAP